jgi:cytochrome P450
VAVICELLGVPLQDQQRFTAWSRGLARSIGPFTFTPEEFERQEVAYEGLSAYMADLVARRRSQPGTIRCPV